MSDDSFNTLIDQAWEAYAAQDHERAVSLATQACDKHSDNGRAHQILACALERLGRFRAADHHFLKSSKASDDPQPQPFRTTWRHFKSSVERAADRLNPELKSRLEDVELVLADHASPEQARTADNPDLLGCFEGPTRTDSNKKAAPRIFLFRRAHEHCTRTAAEFDDEIRRTLYQELGRYLEFDAGDMDQFDLL